MFSSQEQQGNKIPFCLEVTGCAALSIPPRPPRVLSYCDRLVGLVATWCQNWNGLAWAAFHARLTRVQQPQAAFMLLRHCAASQYHATSYHIHRQRGDHLCFCVPPWRKLRGHESLASPLSPSPFQVWAWLRRLSSTSLTRTSGYTGFSSLTIKIFRRACTKRPGKFRCTRCSTQ